MNNNDTFTFELSDLSYDELLDSFSKVNEFISFLDEELLNIDNKDKKDE